LTVCYWFRTCDIPYPLKFQRSGFSVKEDMCFVVYRRMSIVPKNRPALFGDPFLPLLLLLGSSRSSEFQIHRYLRYRGYSIRYNISSNPSFPFSLFRTPDRNIVSIFPLSTLRTSNILHFLQVINPHLYPLYSISITSPNLP
jgi:hypothetical protein